MIMKKLSLLAISVMSIFFLSAQIPGTLYQGFGANGIVLTDFESGGDDDNNAQASVMQDDNKIILGGTTYMNGASNIMIVRYHSHGVVDDGFGYNGIKVINYGGSSEYLTDIAVQPDGKIVAVGYSNTFSKTEVQTKMIALRLNEDGSLDNTFSSDGVTVIDYGSSINAWGTSLAILDDGKIIISGFIEDSPFTYVHTAMCRLSSTGSLDNTFGVNGLLTHDLLNFWCFTDEMIIQNDRIILGGVYFSPDFDRFATVSRYYLDGSIDTDFGDGGSSTLHLQGDQGIAFGSNIGMSLAPDGKILFTSKVIPGTGKSDFALLRFNADGGIDNSFGINGIVINELEGNSYGTDVIVQANGKIIACGSYRNPDPDNYDFLIIRYLASGFPDPSFGTAGTGVVISNISPGIWYSDESNSVIFCNDGKLLVSGYAKTDNSDPDFAMACYYTGINVGIENPEDPQEKLSIYPNPAQDRINITIPPGKEITEINIYNQIGQQLIHQVESSNHLDISILTTGLYEVEVYFGDMRLTERLVKRQ